MSGFKDQPVFEEVTDEYHFCCVLGREHHEPCRCQCDGCQEARQPKN